MCHPGSARFLAQTAQCYLYTNFSVSSRKHTTTTTQEKKTCLNWNNARKTRLLFAWRIAPVNTHLYNSIAYKIISLASHRRLRQIRCRCGDRG